MGAETYPDLHLYAVEHTDGATPDGVVFGQNGMNGSGQFAFRVVEGGANHRVGGTSDQSTSATNSGFAYGYPYVYHSYNKTTNSAALGLTRNYKTALTYPIASPMTGTNGYAYVGGGLFAYGDHKTGEIIVYGSDTFSGTQDQQIQSYLALKYGLHLDQTEPTNYLGSDGTSLMWNSDSNVTESTYINDIFGIGRDDGSALSQVKSKSQQQTNLGIITLSTTSGAFTNDKAFLTVADNAGTATFVTAQAPSGYQVLNKRWQAQEPAGDVGDVTLQIDLGDPQFNVPNVTNLYLMIDVDDNNTYFNESAAGGGILKLYDDGTNGDITANDNIWTVRNVNFPTNDVYKQAKFTIGTRVQGPGGVTTGLVMWLNASDINADGVTTNNPADNANIAAIPGNGYSLPGTYWMDRSPANNHITSAPSNGYIYESDATSQAVFGGNPYFRANNTSAYMNISANSSLKSGTAYFMYQLTSSNTNLDYIAT